MYNKNRNLVNIVIIFISQLVSLALCLASTVIFITAPNNCGYGDFSGGNNDFVIGLSITSIILSFMNLTALYIAIYIRTGMILSCFEFLIFVVSTFVGASMMIIGGSTLIYYSTCHPYAIVNIFTGLSIWIAIVIFYYFRKIYFKLKHEEYEII